MLRHIWQSTDGYRSDYQADANHGINALRAKLLQGQQPLRRLPGYGSRKIILSIAAAAAVLLLTAAFLYRSWNWTEPGDLVLSAEGNDTESIELADGSDVTLKQGSSITYPRHFSEKERKVKLQGEAFFSVERDSGKKFIVETDYLKVEVLGTSFGVLDSRLSRSTEVYVHSGKVAVTIKGSDARIELSAGEKLHYDENAKKAALDRQGLDNTLGWKHGVLRFSNARLPEIFDVIERQFGPQFEISGQELFDCPFTLTIEKDKLEESFSAISKLCPIQFMEASPGHYLVSGECCK